MGDVWKRFNMPALGYPFATFSVLDVCLDDFIVKWSTIQGIQQSCPFCVDKEFTSPLLKLFPAPHANDEDAWKALHAKVNVILAEVAHTASTNSESVENKHATTQSLFSKVRGQVKSLSSAVEDSLLDVIGRAYGKLSQQMSDAEMGKNTKASFSRLGKRKRGAYSQPKGLFRESEDKPLQQRIHASKTKPMRKMSGVFVAKICSENVVGMLPVV
jgi:hypothetical protein